MRYLSKPFPVMTTKSKECGGRAAGTVCALAGAQRFVFRWSLCVSCKDLLAKDSAECCTPKGIFLGK